MKIFAETDRLILREILPSDLDGMFELDSGLEVHKYLGNNPISNKEQIVHIINFIRQQYINNVIGRWDIINKITNEFIGWSGLKYVTKLTNNHKNYYDIGYRLIRKYCGRGIATESAIASLKYAFENLKVRVVYVMSDCGNIGLNNILRKVGMKLIEKIEFDGSVHNWCKIQKDEYQNRELNI